MRVKVKTSLANSMLLVQFGVSSSMFIVSRAVRTVSSLTYWPPSVRTIGPRSPPPPNIPPPPRRRPPSGPNWAKQTPARASSAKRRRNWRDDFMQAFGPGPGLRISQDVFGNRGGPQNETKMAERERRFNLGLTGPVVSRGGGSKRPALHGPTPRSARSSTSRRNLSEVDLTRNFREISGRNLRRVFFTTEAQRSQRGVNSICFPQYFKFQRRTRRARRSYRAIERARVASIFCFSSFSSCVWRCWMS